MQQWKRTAKPLRSNHAAPVSPVLVACAHRSISLCLDSTARPCVSSVKYFTSTMHLECEDVLFENARRSWISVVAAQIPTGAGLWARLKSGHGHSICLPEEKQKPICLNLITCWDAHQQGAGIESRTRMSTRHCDSRYSHPKQCLNLYVKCPPSRGGEDFFLILIIVIKLQKDWLTKHL